MSTETELERLRAVVQSVDEVAQRLGKWLTEAAELLTDDADPGAASALETIIERTYPALLAALAAASAGPAEPSA